jgi:hypothetical protein
MMSKPKQEQAPIRPLHLDKQEPELTPGTVAFALAAQNILNHSTQSSGQEQAIGRKVRVNLCEQAGTVIIAEHAGHLVKQSSVRMLERIDEYIALERGIRQKERHAEDQEHMEVIGHQVREMMVNAQLAIQHAAINKYAELVSRPLALEEGEADTVVIEEDPGLLGGLLGRRRVTRVAR